MVSYFKEIIEYHKENWQFMLPGWILSGMALFLGMYLLLNGFDEV